jgi:hypothetical protein
MAVQRRRREDEAEAHLFTHPIPSLPRQAFPMAVR